MSTCHRGLTMLVVALAALAGCDKPVDQSRQNRSTHSSTISSLQTPYLDRLQDFKTSLHYNGPSPQDWQAEPRPDNTHEVIYESDDLSLKAWVFVPSNNQTSIHPALVYFHGGFAFGASDLEDCKPFMNAGFVVMCPMFRGENGNPGNYELMLREVADAKAAVQWIADQPYIDRNRIFAFGHSSGGGIAALLSLRSDVPVQHSGSSGGLYAPSVFDSWRDIVPFDLSDPRERELRTLLGNISDMKFPHYAYLGTQDTFENEKRLADQEMSSGNSKLTITMVEGDHFTSLQFAMMRYFATVNKSSR